MVGFRECLQKAFRMEEDVDWSRHYIDYARFKQRLKFFARRRSQIRNMVATAADKRMSEETLRDLCGPKQRLRSAKKMVGGANPEHVAAYYQQLAESSDQQQQEQNQEGLPNVVSIPAASGDYVEMGDSDDGMFPFDEDHSQSSANASSIGGFPNDKRRNQRYIMRRLSIAERNEIIVFLEHEVSHRSNRSSL